MHCASCRSRRRFKNGHLLSRRNVRGFDQYLLDTNIVIALRDGDAAIEGRVRNLTIAPSMSIVTRVELEGGLDIEPEERECRRERLDLLAQMMPVLSFNVPDVLAFRRIIEAVGFARNKTLDRMIAAQAMAADLVLVTANVRDFRDIPNLQIENWSN